MARPCIVCNSADRQQIELMLASGDLPPQINRAFPDVSEGSIRRHRDSGHLPDSVARELVIRNRSSELLDQGLTADPNVIYAMLAQTVATARDVADRAADRGNDALILKAVKEVRDSLALLHKFTVRDDENSNGSGSDSAVEELTALARALRKVLPSHPEAAQALRAELRLSGHFDLANTIASVITVTVDAVETA